MEVNVYDPTVLREVLEELHRETAAGSEEGDTGLGDFGDHLVPRLVERGRTFAHHHEGYWRDLGQPHHYVRAHQEILTDDVGVLSVVDWPVLSRHPQRAPARVLDGGVVVDSLLSPGTRVSGRVERSVLGPGVVVEAGALVADSVVFTDAVVAAGAEVHWTVLDTRSVVEADARVGEPGTAALDDPDAVTLVGCDSRIGRGVTVETGARLEPGTVVG